MTVGELIEELKKCPQDMPVTVDMNIMWPPEADYNKLEVSQRTWVDSNYPWNRPDFEYINIE